MFKKRRERTFSDNTMQVKRRRFLRKIHFSKLTITILLTTILILLSLHTVFFSGVFTVQTVEFTPRDIRCASIDAIKSALPKKTNILFINTEELAITLKAKFPCFETVRIAKKFPDILTFSLSERKTTVLLKTSVRTQPSTLILPEPLTSTTEASASSQSAMPKLDEDPFKIDESQFSKLFSVDRTGFIIGENPSTDTALPMIYFVSYEELKVNEHLEEGLMESALLLLEKVKEQQLVVESAKIEGRSLFLNGPIRVTFLLKKEIEEQIIPLQLILQKAKIDSETVEKIDLRFDKPVVVYKNQAKKSKN